jgi:hypothetical protein
MCLTCSDDDGDDDDGDDGDSRLYGIYIFVN